MFIAILFRNDCPLPDATATIRAKSGLGIGDADSKAARLAADRGKHREAAGDNPQALAQ
jgi:hypothetical protein